MYSTHVSCMHAHACMHACVYMHMQIKPDPEFPTIDFPNPEEKGALNKAMETGTSVCVCEYVCFGQFTKI